MFGQYRGLRRELYILFWGKAATNMGAMIWPMLTLILSNKLGMNAQEIAKITIAMGVVQFPANLLGGKLADCCNKKKLIIICDLVTVICYLTAAVLPVSMAQILLFFTAGIFQTMENPSYDALVAEAKAQVEDMSVRYNTFAQAEASIINHAVIIPYGVEGDGFKATRLNELEAEYAPYGLARQRYKYQKLRTEPMSQNEFNTLYEAWQAERAKALAAE